MSQALVEVVSEPTLDELAATANREHGLSFAAATRAVDHAICAGHALIAIRTQIRHGDWDRWVDTNFDGSDRIAKTYMRLARNEDLLPAGEHRVDSALKALRGLPGPNNGYPLEVREEALRLRAEGLSQREVARRVGVSSTCVRYWAGEGAPKPKSREQRARDVARRARLRKARVREQQFRAMKRIGGKKAEAYSLVRRSLQILDHALGEAEGREVRRAVESAIARLHDAEDELVRASKLS